jgi:cell division protein ZapE
LSIAIETPPQALSLASHYRDLAAKGEISLDDAQLAAAARFDALNARLNRAPAKGRSLGRLFRPPAVAAVKGLYVHGEVGRGKTMLMDAFFPLATVERKRRAHFHEFMAEVHERVHAARKSGKANGGKANGQKGEDPIAAVAAEIAAETRLLCLDEFMVTDITDAMILSRLFSQLFKRGLVLVATSNSPPEELYKNGLNRALFLPFIDLLKQRAEIVRLAARTDYRLEKLGGAPVYVTPLGRDADAALDAIWRRLTGTEHGKPMALPMKGREIHVPQAEKGVARFTFADLCQKPLGASDFLKIARSFHTVMIDHIPVLKDGERNAARRFISLIDSLYDNRVKLVASAATEPAGIYRASDGPEAASFQRAVSRLIEMRSEDYLALPHGSIGETEHREPTS